MRPELLQQIVQNYSSKLNRSQIAVDDMNREFRKHLVAFLSENLHLASSELLSDVLDEESKWSYCRDINSHSFARLLSHLLETTRTPALVQLLVVLRRNMDLDLTLSHGLILSKDCKQVLLRELDTQTPVSEGCEMERLLLARDIIARSIPSDEK